MIDIKSVIAKNISELRTEKGMTQLELAERLHYSDKAVSKWERGESVPEISTLKAISELFCVTLDYLTSEEHEEAKEEKSCASNEASNDGRVRRSAVTAISVFCVVFLSTLAYILIDILAPSVVCHWLCFIYALPLCMVVWLIFNSIWFNKRHNYPIISVLMWGVLLSVHLSLICVGFSSWQIYLLGIPGQVAIVIWSMIRPKKK